MTTSEKEYAVIKNAICTIGVLCASDEYSIIDKLTGFLWDDDEAKSIKESDGKYRIEVSS